ncbi:hypothetical protein BDR03DRAFT_987058 [Suillus americanus]|nr:hypothetical protein BDR03DRAFT_987058 [Suillus americanus]
MPSEPLTFFQQGPMNGQSCFYECNSAWHSQTTIPPRQLEHFGGKGPSQDVGTKRRSTPSASLVTSSQSGTLVESVLSLEPRLCLLLKPKLLKSPVFDPKDDFCQHIIAAIRKGGEGPKHEMFQRKIMITFWMQSNLMIIEFAMPLRTTMEAIITSLPLPLAFKTTLHVHMNTMVEKGEDNEDEEDSRNLGIPDMLIQCETRDAEFRLLWPFKFLFSQSSEAVESKIQYFTDKNPHIEGGTHFHIAEVERYTLPSDEWVVKQELDKKKVGHIREVGGTAASDGILSCSHTWLQPLTVTITTWLHPPNGRLKTTNHSAHFYATTVLFPQQDAAGLQNIAPNTLVDWDACVGSLETAAKQAGFRRYHKWHKNFLKRTINKVKDAEYVLPASANKFPLAFKLLFVYYYYYYYYYYYVFWLLCLIFLKMLPVWGTHGLCCLSIRKYDLIDCLRDRYTVLSEIIPISYIREIAGFLIHGGPLLSQYLRGYANTLRH